MIYFLLACFIGISSCSLSNTTTSSGTEEVSDYTIDPTCPLLDYLTYDYYPGNCSKFYECEHGKRYLLDCPDGMYWNTEYNYCDYPENVDCSRENATTISSTPVTSTDDTVTNQTSKDFFIDTTCPFLDYLTYDYYPGNCSKFYECEHGRKYLLDCPDGMYWNTKYNYCDYPENVDCSRENATTISSTSATSTDDTVTNQTTENFFIDTTCPFLDYLTYDYYPGNCSKFYECEHGKKYLLDCPDGMYWNTKYNYCDYPENVDCSRENATTISSTSATSTDDTSVTDQTTSPTVTTTGPICQDDPDGTLIPDPNDCSKFYECSGGSPVEFFCPAGTMWDKEKEACDFARNVDC